MRKKRRRIDVKKLALVVIAFVAIMGIITTTWAYVDNQKKIKAEQLRIEEQKRKEEEEKKKYTVGTSHEGKKYTYDANIVAEKATLRKLISLNEEIANTCYVGKEPLESILEDTEKRGFDLVQLQQIHQKY